jgi:lipopolysaccharide export system ATP-binding protein
MILLETTQLIKTYNRRRVVDEVSFVLQQQEIIGLLGRNGAGKTTTFRMILGMVTPDSGAVAFLGQDITQLPMYKRARRGIGYLSQERSDFRRLTVWQNLQAILETRSDISRSQRTEKAERLLAQYGLTRQRNQRADTLSGGERRKLEIARALVTDPQLILLDEPFSGVDPIAVEDLQREVIRLKQEFGKSVLITDHNVAQTLKVCDRALIIEEGRVKFEGTPREVINDPGVRSAYTGNLFRGDEFDDPPPSSARSTGSTSSPQAAPPQAASVNHTATPPKAASMLGRMPAVAPVRQVASPVRPAAAPPRSPATLANAAPARPAMAPAQPAAAPARPQAAKPPMALASPGVATGAVPASAPARPAVAPGKPAVKASGLGVRPPP